MLGHLGECQSYLCSLTCYVVHVAVRKMLSHVHLISVRKFYFVLLSVHFFCVDTMLLDNYNIDEHIFYRDNLLIIVQLLV